MTGMRTTFSMAIFLAFVFVNAAWAQRPASKPPQKYPLWDFDEAGCRAKGRLQDLDYCASHLMDQIIKDGKEAIPVLISQLRETRATPRPIYDYWALTTSGDIAYFILNDLFTDADWKTFNMPGLEPLYDKDCHSYAEDCWRTFVKKHGRKFVQDQWLAAWNKNKDRIYWDDKARCYRLSTQPKQKELPEKR